MEKSFEENVKEIRTKLLKENIEKVMKDANKDIIPQYLDKKIKNESLRKGFKYSEILEQIKVNKLYASFFAKDPIKQSLYENMQLEKVKSEYKNIKHLRNTYICISDDGEIIKGRKNAYNL
jgi:hypothetical protein